MALLVQGLNYAYHLKTGASRVVLEDISLCLNPGEVVGLWGPNGAGKSTLFRLICGILPAPKGTIQFNDSEAYGQKGTSSTLPVTMAIQHPENQLYEATVRREIGAGLQIRGFASDIINSRVQTLGERLFSREWANIEGRSPFAISGGQKRLVALASVLVMESPYILLDEPTEGLDYRSVNTFHECIREYATSGKQGILIASHRLEDLLVHCDRVIWLEKGRIQGTGSYDSMAAAIESRLTAPEHVTAGRYVLHLLKSRGVPLSLAAVSSQQCVDEIMAARERRIEQ